MIEKKFRIQDENGNPAMGDYELDLENGYISSCGRLLPGQKRPADLEVDEFCKKEYSLSGQKPTVYVIVRVR